ncbi:MAG: hypothetical protein IKO27_04185 [Ruminococcus sp.]|nr:hypothetical protein [Ruminococcus sp.]
MSRKCGACYARVEAGMKICPNCGRLLADIGERHEYQPEKNKAPAADNAGRRNARKPAAAAPEKPVRVKAPAAAEKPVQKKASRAAEKPRVKQRAEQAAEDARPRWRGLVKKLIAAAVILTAVYFALFGLQVLRIRHSTYDFTTDMKLAASNYGEAFDRSVTEGSWSYNPFTFSATYTGIHDGKEIEIDFSALISVKVKSVRVGDEVKNTDKQINIYLMGLFI